MNKITVGIITVSDRSSRGERDDLSGPEIRLWAQKHDFRISRETVIPDERETIKDALRTMSDEGIDLILTTGGTGFAPRDVTPEATLDVLDKIAPGFAEAMRHKSLAITPHAMLSRAVSGIRKKSLIINLPGSPKAVRENLMFIETAIPHALELIKSQISDCSESSS